jgi:hypothetical protein
MSGLNVGGALFGSPLEAIGNALAQLPTQMAQQQVQQQAAAQQLLAPYKQALISNPNLANDPKFQREVTTIAKRFGLPVMNAPQDTGGPAAVNTITNAPGAAGSPGAQAATAGGGSAATAPLGGTVAQNVAQVAGQPGNQPGADVFGILGVPRDPLAMLSDQQRTMILSATPGEQRDAAIAAMGINPAEVDPRVRSAAPYIPAADKVRAMGDITNLLKANITSGMGPQGFLSLMKIYAPAAGLSSEDVAALGSDPQFMAQFQASANVKLQQWQQLGILNTARAQKYAADVETAQTVQDLNRSKIFNLNKRTSLLDATTQATLERANAAMVSANANVTRADALMQQVSQGSWAQQQSASLQAAKFVRGDMNSLKSAVANMRAIASQALSNGDDPDSIMVTGIDGQQKPLTQALQEGTALLNKAASYSTGVNTDPRAALNGSRGTSGLGASNATGAANTGQYTVGQVYQDSTGKKWKFVGGSKPWQAVP